VPQPIYVGTEQLNQTVDTYNVRNKSEYGEMEDAQNDHKK
jgi:hypothetical protein